VIDPKTFRRIPWEKGKTPFFLADFRDKKGNALEICPRGLLSKIKDDAASMGYNALFSQEFEWFNFKEEPNALHDRNFDSPDPLTRGMFGYSILGSARFFLSLAYF
jgi:glutamine synthetase